MSHARPFAALTVLALIAFWPLVLHPTETLYSNTSDLLAEHLPAKLFLVRSLRETGELPLWNPEQYAGSPFVHDIQVGLFYPPHVPLYFISEPAVGPFLSWLVFAHVLLAGCLMYAYARHAGMGELAAFTAGVGYMLAPRWMMQLFLAGHVVTQGIAWIPLVILCVERAIQRRSWRWAVGGGVVYALLILGTHPQWTFYGSLLIGLWPLRLLTQSRKRERREGPESAADFTADYGEPGRVSAGSTRVSAGSTRVSPGSTRASAGSTRVSAGSTTKSHAESPSLPALTQPGSPLTSDGAPRKRTLLIRWLLAEAIVVLVGLALSAVQLQPTMEAAGESSRARGMGQSWSLDGAKAAATTLIGPIPDRVAEPIHWETRGGIGFTWAVLAIVGARLGGRRAIVPAMIAAGMLVYALGGSWLMDRLPGFDNFRMPTRMLLTLAFPVAYLAGLGVQSLTHDRARSTLLMATAFLAIVLANAVTVRYRDIAFAISQRMIDPCCWIYWIVIPAGWALFVVFSQRWRSAKRSVAATTIMIVDLFIVAVPYPDTRPMGEIYPRSPIIDYIRENNPEGLRVLDGWDDPFTHRWSLLGPGSPGASVFGVPTVLGYNPVDVARYRQFLAFLAGVSEPQKAFSGDFTHPVVMPFPIECRKLRVLLADAYWIDERVNWPAGMTDDGEPELIDRYAQSYNFLGPGIQKLPVMEVWKNQDSPARAFVVARARSQLLEAEVFAQLVSIDIHHEATVEDWDRAVAPLPRSDSPPGAAKMVSHSPNHIHIALDGRTAGLLVLTDPWYPGWVCRIDGQEVKIWKADYAFRGVMVPEGSREVVFRFEPTSYRRGKWVSMGTVAALITLLLVSLGRRLRK